MTDTGVVQIQVTCDDRSVLERIIRSLVDERLIACGQVLGPVLSTYWWQGAIEQTEEWLGLCKTSRERCDAAIQSIGAQHPYDVPELLVLPVEGGLPAYMDWVRHETAPGLRHDSDV